MNMMFDCCSGPTEPESQTSIRKVSTQLPNLLHEGKCNLDPSKINWKYLSRNTKYKPDKHILKQDWANC